MTRNAALAKIHIARKDLGLTEDDYRALLARVAGVVSAAKLGPEGQKAVLAELKRLGFRERPKIAGRVDAPGDRAHVGKVMQLWKEAAQKGAIRDGSDAALRTFVQRQTKGPDSPEGVSAPQFLTPKQATRVIEGVKAILARHWRKART